MGRLWGQGGRRLAAVIVAVLLVAGAIAAAVVLLPGARVGRLLEKTKSADPATREAAIAELAALSGEREIRCLAHHIGDEDSCVRDAAMTALVRMGLRAVAPIVAVSAEAENRAGLVHKNKYIQKLFRSSSDRYERVFVTGENVIHRIGHPAVAPLSGLLQSNDEVVGDVAARGVLALAQKDDWAILARSLKAKNPFVRRRVARTLLRLAPPEAADSLATAAVGQNATAYAARCALGRAGDPRATPLLAADLTARSPFVRYSTVRMLGGMKQPECEKLVESALTDGDWKVRQCAAIMLWRMRAAEARPALEKAAQYGDPKDSDGKAARAARAALESLDGGPSYWEADTRPLWPGVPGGNQPPSDDMEAKRALFEKARSGEWRTRQSAIGELAQFEGADVRDALLEALRDPYGDVRVAAVVSLWRHKDAKTVSALEAALDDVDPYVRNCALYCLPYVPGYDAGPALVRALDDITIVRCHAASELAGRGDVKVVKEAEGRPDLLNGRVAADWFGPIDDMVARAALGEGPAVESTGVR